MRNQNKKQFCLNFLKQLINNPKFLPFLRFNDEIFGFFDYKFTSRHKQKYHGLSLIGLYEQAEKRRSFTHEWMCGQLRKIFTRISDYVLSDDPLQITCEMGFRMISNFQNQYANQFKKRKTKPDEDSSICSVQKLPNINDQIEMIFYLKNYERDEETMRKIGEVCQIVEETDEEYVFDLSRSVLWEAMIGKYIYYDQ